MDTVKTILSAALKQWGVKHKYNQQSAITHWGEIVGDEIGKHSCPTKIEYGIIVVTVVNSSWCHHLSMMKHGIITKINDFIGEKLISDIRFQAGSLKDCRNEAEPSTEALPDIRLAKLDNTEIIAVEEIVNVSQNGELREKLSRIIKKDMSLKKIKKIGHWHTCTNCLTLCAPGELYCTVCDRKRRSKLLAEIRALLREAPWLKYHELNQYLKCTPYEYDDAKNHVVASLLPIIKNSADKPDKMTLVTLSMLITCMKPEAITEEILEATLSKIRRKKHVFTSGR
ncbi:MAG: DUF721 domain-containing protein [Pelosinus sp.]|nr:DUF721 domain-containing protein [Pelosinus sp.]